MNTTRTLLLSICFFVSTAIFSQTTNNLQNPTSINENGSAPATSAILDLNSDSLGMLVPRMTTAQRTFIASPATGLLVFDTDTGSFWFYENNTWDEILTSMPPAEGGATAPATPIPDCNPAGISSVINLGSTDTVATNTRFRVCMDITHPQTDNLDISLAAPDGTAIDLSSDNGGTSNNYTGTCFTTGAPSPVTGGAAPFSGNWQPEGPFSAFTGKAIAGNWVLTVVDDECIYGGQLESWSLNISRPSAVATLLVDADGDTRISVEDLPDEDIVRLEAGGMVGLEIRPDSAVFTGLVRVHGNFVSGRQSNTASGFYSFVGGGNRNDASGFYSFVGGGNGNTASGSESFVGGGFLNDASGFYSFVGGGGLNIASGSSSFVSGGSGTASGPRSFAGGGSGNTASGDDSFVGGGRSNTASGDESFAGGGDGNTATGYRSFVGSGTKLTAESYSETVFGTYNTDYTPNSTSSFNAADRLFVIGNGTSTGNRSNAVTVLKNGNVGIGAGIPTRTLDVRGELFVKEENGVAYFQSSTSNSFIALLNNGGAAATNVGYFDNGADDYFYVDTPGGAFGELRVGTNGRTGLGRTAVTNRLEVDGNASKNTAGNWLANSDARLKKNIRPLDSEAILEKILTLQGITYEWDDDQTGSQRPEGTMYGFTAQNIQQVFPELVTEDNLGFLQTAYGTYDAMYVEAMRAQQRLIENSELKIENLEEENEDLRAEMASLQSQLAEMDELKTHLSELEANMAMVESMLSQLQNATAAEEHCED